MSLLEHIDFPHELRKLGIERLPEASKELRETIIDMVSNHGGHFAASLGVVELTVALHYVYDTPYDLLVWDVGHQAYGHKLLTGRKKVFHTNRKYKGLSGFPSMKESIYDAFGTGHSSTSISAALGMSVASQRKGEDRRVVAIIGDGAMTAGLAFEGLNHAAFMNTDILIILNDNNMSIDPNVGGWNSYLTKISVSPTFNKARDQLWDLLGKLPKVSKRMQSLASSIEASIKGIAQKRSNFFESLGLRYFGPADGHDVINLAHLLKDIRNIKGPKLLHIITTKGKGYDWAEKDQTLWHAPGIFDKRTGLIEKAKSDEKRPPKYQDVFGKTILELAEKNDKVMAVTPAMSTGSSLKEMIEKMPDRAFDVGICEQHAVTFSAGLATQGMRVFCNIYSTFMQRGYDQVIHDVAIQNLPVIFCLDRGGLVGEDGATHHGIYDLAYMRCAPNIIVSAPLNEIELRNLMYTAQLESNKHPFSIRYPRGHGVTIDWEVPFEEMPIGKGERLIKGEKIAVLSIGHIGNMAIAAIKKIKDPLVTPSLYNMRFVKPIDAELIRSVSASYDLVITLEDGCVGGGFGGAVLECMQSLNAKRLPRVLMMGVPDRVIEQGSLPELYKECGIDEESIRETIEKHWKEK